MTPSCQRSKPTSLANRARSPGQFAHIGDSSDRPSQDFEPTGLIGPTPAIASRQDSGVRSASMDDDESRRIAGVIGPTMITMIVSEFPLVQPRLYDAQIPPVVYLSGVLMFVAGLAIVRAHNHWRHDWTVLVTLSGWFALTLGAVRMFAASGYQRGTDTVGAPIFILIESVLLVCGFVMTFKAYVKRGGAHGSTAQSGSSNQPLR